jgi:hypothetical protein
MDFYERVSFFREQMPSLGRSSLLRERNGRLFEVHLEIFCFNVNAGNCSFMKFLVCLIFTIAETFFVTIFLCKIFFWLEKKPFFLGIYLACKHKKSLKHERGSDGNFG